MLRIPLLSALFWMAVAFCSLPPFATAQSRSRHEMPQYIGDVVLRLDLSGRIFSFSNETGELLTTAISERGVFQLVFTPEYGYFFDEQTLFLLSAPLDIEINPNVGAFFEFNLGLGVRRLFARIFFADAQLLITFVSRSRFRLGFGGILLGAGMLFPVSERVRLSLLIRFPFNFVSGIQFGINAGGGLEILF